MQSGSWICTIVEDRQIKFTRYYSAHFLIASVYIKKYVYQITQKIKSVYDSQFRKKPIMSMCAVIFYKNATATKN